MTAAGARIALSAHIGIEWLSRAAPALCPNCGAQGEAAQVLDIEYAPPDDEDRHRFILQKCPACAVLFTDNRQMMDYGTERLVQVGWDAYQVQLGAGIWPIAGQIARLERPAGARVLEIGGAYGFGLDFCIRARGWRGEGYDPSPLASFGMQELQLRIAQEYFTIRQVEEGPWDVALATELIEHVSYPVAFLLLMRRALGEGGVLILSTPDADFITPNLAPPALLPLLSPGAHTVLQTAPSLEAAMRQAGFVHIRILREGMTLIAYASVSPFTLNEDFAAHHALYRDYLVGRAEQTALLSDLRLGFAGRGVFEAANKADWEAADAAWAALLPAVSARFGLDLETMRELPEGAMSCSLEELSRLMPLGLGMILFGRAMRLLEGGAGRAALEPLLRLAYAANEALLAALARRSLTDGLSVSLAALLRTELLICAAAMGREEAVTALIALGDEPSGWRGFVELVNAGAITQAGALKQSLPVLPGPEIPAGLRRDALLSLVNFHLAPGGEPWDALACAEMLSVLGEVPEAALLGVFIRLVNAGRYEDAETLRTAEPILGQAAELPGEAAQDARWAGLILDLQRSRALAAARGAAAWERQGGDAARLAPIYTEALVRLANDGDFAAARALGMDEGMARRLALCAPALRADALAALLLLEARPGEGEAAAVPARLRALQGADMPDERRVGLGFQAFSMLVNQAAFAPAEAILPFIEPELVGLQPPFSPHARDALFAAGILFLQGEETLRRAALAFARLRDALLKQALAGGGPDDLFWPALRGEVLALHRLNRAEEATVLLQSFIDDYPGAPEDLREQLRDVRA